MKQIKPVTGYIIVEAVPRKLTKEQKERYADKKTTMLPPSDYFVVDGGTTEYVAGQELVLHGAAMLIPLKEKQSVYLLNSNEIIGSYES